MKCGVSVAALNTGDWERSLAKDSSRRPAVLDHVLWEQNLALGDLAEPLGFDAIWTFEHRNTPYGMVPNPMQLLAYFAGRTERVELGTMVIVLPWWKQPVRLAEEIAFLDMLARGRKLNLGVGRGLAKSEFDAMTVDRDESRGRFKEVLDVVRLALTQEWFSYEGEFFQIPETTLRPQPRSTDIVSRMLGAAGSPPSLPILAELGLELLLVVPKPVDEMTADVALFNQIRRGVGLAPTQPVIYQFAYCNEDEAQAEEIGARYHAGYNFEATTHYGLLDPAQWQNLKSYDFYVESSKLVQEGTPAAGETMQLRGTPAQIIEKVKHIQEKTSMRELACIFQYGGMPPELAEQSMRLFAAEVLPALNEMETPLHAEAQAVAAY